MRKKRVAGGGGGGGCPLFFVECAFFIFLFTVSIPKRMEEDSGDDGASLSVFVGTWNVGNVAPRMDACVEWLAAARGHHVIAVAAQEASYPHSRSNLPPKTVSSEMRDVPYHVKRLGWLRSSKITRFSGAVAGAMAGGVAAGPFAPIGMLVGAAAGYYSSTKVTEEIKVRNHWFDVVKAAVGPGYRVVQTAVLLQMRLIVLVQAPIADLVREVRVGYQVRRNPCSTLRLGGGEGSDGGTQPRARSFPFRLSISNSSASRHWTACDAASSGDDSSPPVFFSPFLFLL